MQRSQASIINRIDFLERIEIKYLNVPNYYKEIRTKTKESGMK
jgi:hypothetical protein